MKTRAILVAMSALIAGCASFNDAMTPSLHIIEDKFDGATIVRQDPVSASDALVGAWHTLGFEWSSKQPRNVFVTAGTNGVVPVTNLAFNADGDKLPPAALASEYSETDHGWTSRRFVMPLQDFLIVSRARDVKMRLGQGDNYSVSEFGPAHSGAIVNSKFKPFTDRILQISSSL